MFFFYNLILDLERVPPLLCSIEIRNIFNENFASFSGQSPVIVYNDKKCSASSSQDLTVSLSTCLTTFNCADGGCVNLTARCDGRADCGDSTDELNCDSLMPVKEEVDQQNF
jgi:Low-density lipoprotein receptor domain class A